MSSGGLSTGVVMSGGAGIGLQGSCPEHYSEFKGSCFARIFGKMMSYAQAEAKCGEDGAALAVVQSREENDYLTQMLYQRPGWIGLSNKDVGGFQWDHWTNWGPGEPSSLNGFVTKLPASGAATGDAFDDQRAGVRVSLTWWKGRRESVCVLGAVGKIRKMPQARLVALTHSIRARHTSFIDTHTNRTSVNWPFTPRPGS